MLFFLFLLLVFSPLASCQKFLLYRATPTDQRGLKMLNKLQILDDKYKVDVWKESRQVGDHADLMISEKDSKLLERRLRLANVPFVITVSDVEKLIVRNEGKRARSRSSRHLNNSSRLHDDPILDSEPDLDHSRIGHLKKAKYPFGDYASYSDMMKYMRTIEFYYPNITKIIRLGTTHEGKPIEGLKIGYPITSTNKRSVWIDGNIHAREWASSHTALFVINQLVSNYGRDDTITHYVNSLNFFIVPCLNPDGYEYTRSSPSPAIRLWRKNRSPEKCHKSSWGGEKCCRGVDLNRNFQFHWAESGSSFEPCSNIYHGEHVFSEPEALAVRNFMESPDQRGKFDAFITLHSYAQLWIYPYSHIEQSYPEDIDELRRTARRAITRLHRMYGTQYRMGTGADTLAPASGGSDDWAKSEMAIKYVYLVELRPEMELSNGFILHKNELIPTAVETWEGMKAVIEGVLQHNNIHQDTRTKISPSQMKKQLYRMRLLGLASAPSQQPRGNLSGITKINSKDSADVIKHPHSMTAATAMTSSPSDFAVTTTSSGKHKPTTWRSRHFSRFMATTEMPDHSSSSSSFHPTPPSSPPTFQSTSPSIPSTAEPTFAFFTFTRPASFRDETCRDMRYSCAFWLRHNPAVCEEQLSFMKAQCAYTCKFCIPQSDSTNRRKRSAVV